MPKVSVVVPIYNAEKYLVQCIDSIVNQTLKDIEIILVDDGSTDSSSEICKRYLSDPRIIYFRKPNGGAVLARRDGIAKASGEYIGFVDSDDWLESTMYETLYLEAKAHNADIVSCNCIENENGHRCSPDMELGVYDRRGIEDAILPRSLAYIDDNGEKRAIRWANWLRIYKKPLLSDIKHNPEIRRCEDLVLHYEALLKANVYVYLGDKYLYHYRVVPDSKSRRYTVDAWSAFRALILHLYNDTERLNNPVMTAQMHLRAFFSVTDCLENEIKFYSQNKKNALEQIRRITDDEINDRYYGKIPIEKMNKRYQGYYELIHEKKPRKIIAFDKRLKRREKIDRRIIRPFKQFVTEGKLTGKLYKRVRGKK